MNLYILWDYLSGIFRWIYNEMILDFLNDFSDFREIMPKKSMVDIKDI